MLTRIRLSLPAFMPIVAMFAVAVARRWWP
jgi:hypothetical protein